MEKHVNKFALIWALGLTAFILMGVTIPNTFVTGTSISSAEVNANFAALKAAVDALESPTRRGTVLLHATVLADGTLWSSYTSTGTPITVDYPAVGAYYIALPDGEAFDPDTHAVSVVPAGTVPCYAASSGTSSGIPRRCRIHMFDPDGSMENHGFHITIWND